MQGSTEAWLNKNKGLLGLLPAAAADVLRGGGEGDGDEEDKLPGSNASFPETQKTVEKEEEEEVLSQNGLGLTELPEKRKSRAKNRPLYYRLKRND